MEAEVDGAIDGLAVGSVGVIVDAAVGKLDGTTLGLNEGLQVGDAVNNGDG